MAFAVAGKQKKQTNNMSGLAKQFLTTRIQSTGARQPAGTKPATQQRTLYKHIRMRAMLLPRNINTTTSSRTSSRGLIQEHTAAQACRQHDRPHLQAASVALWLWTTHTGRAATRELVFGEGVTCRKLTHDSIGRLPRRSHCSAGPSTSQLETSTSLPGQGAGRRKQRFPYSHTSTQRKGFHLGTSNKRPTSHAYTFLTNEESSPSDRQTRRNRQLCRMSPKTQHKAQFSGHQEHTQKETKQKTPGPAAALENSCPHSSVLQPHTTPPRVTWSLLRPCAGNRYTSRRPRREINRFTFLFALQPEQALPPFTVLLLPHMLPVTTAASKTKRNLLCCCLYQ